MTDEQHAKILYAYLTRLSSDDLMRIVESQKDAHYASMNLGTSSQLKAQEASFEAVQAVIGGLLTTDKEVLADIVTRTLRAKSSV